MNAINFGAGSTKLLASIHFEMDLKVVESKHGWLKFKEKVLRIHYIQANSSKVVQLEVNKPVSDSMVQTRCFKNLEFLVQKLNNRRLSKVLNETESYYVYGVK